MLIQKRCLLLLAATIAVSTVIAQPRLKDLEILEHIQLPPRTSSTAEQATISVQSLAHRAPVVAQKAYRKAARAVEEGNLALAVEHLEAGLASDPENAEAHSDAGVLQTMLGRREEAVAHFELVLKIDPKASGANLLLGLSLVSLHRYTKSAEQALERVKQGFPESRMALADIHLHKGELGKARHEIEAYMSSGHPAYRRTAEAWLKLTTF